MGIHAYDKIYLDDAMNNLGDMLDYAVNQCGFESGRFMDMFIASGYSAQFENGTPRYISGMSGAELARCVIESVMPSMAIPKRSAPNDKSVEFWCGWVLAFYQWKSGRSFKEILSAISMEEVEKLYPTLHEADERKFCDTVDAVIKRKAVPVKLKTLRTNIGLSQSELAGASGVSLRSIQMYEQRQKDINKAQAITLLKLSKALGCGVEDLIER